MPPKTADQFEEMRVNAKGRIVTAALKLMANNGYHATSIAQIAREAGVSKGLMYNYFSTKEGLLVAIVDQAMATGLEMANHMATLPDPALKIKFIIEFSFQWFTHNAEYARMLLALSLKVGMFPQMQAVVEAKIQGATTFYESLFRDMGYDDPLSEAFLLGATLDGLALQYLSVGDKMGLDKMKQTLIDKYCKPL
ncbi:MAG: TetR/AcrR family transcriptional regulator [Bacteroidetes bacterium]|nr:TetR/AcrR family transcriptional regulator [Bacteroidota bacterium]